MIKNKYIINLNKDILPEMGIVLKHIYLINPVLRDYLEKTIGKKLNRQEWKTAKKIFLKGARKTTKTRFVIRLILWLMIIDPRASFVVIQETIKESGSKLMTSFQKDINRIDKDWPGFKTQWTAYYSEKKKLERNNGQWIQEIRFVSFDETATGGFETNNEETYWAGYFLDEAVNRKQKNKVTFLETEELLEGLDHLDETLNRSISEIYDHCEHKVLDLIRIIAYNPNQGHNPIAKDVNKYLIENLEEMCKYGYQTAWNEEKQELYIQLSQDINDFLIPEVKDLIHDKRWDWQQYLTDRFGMNNYGRGTILSHVWNRVEEKNRWFDSLTSDEVEQFINNSVIIDVGIDVGYTDSKTSLQVIAWNPSHRILYSAGEYVYNHAKAKIKKVPKQLAHDMIKFLWEFEMRYQNIRYQSKKPNIFVDGAEPLFIDALNDSRVMLVKEMASKGYFADGMNKEPLTSYNGTLPFRNEWKVLWDTEQRAKAWEDGIGMSIIVPFRRLSPELFKELPGMKVIDSKRIKMLGNDDCINAFEYGAFLPMSKLFKPGNDYKFTNKQLNEIITSNVVKFDKY